VKALLPLLLLSAPALAQAPPRFETPPPAEAGSGPPRAADAIWGAAAMQPSREALAKEHGASTRLWFMTDRAELRVTNEPLGYLWDVQGWWGSDTDKLWVKSEGEGTFGEPVDEAELQALWSHAVAPFFDLQLGLRQDFAPGSPTYAVLGLQGLAPYRFELDAALFLSTDGNLTARIEAELDQRLTQRLIIQPRVEFNLAAQTVPELGIGAGMDSISLGVRLRYEFVREFAPYIGVEQDWAIGTSADYARARGDSPSVTAFVIGIRSWF
jgi:copper resistance protein B